jgi:hypothetical protein
MVTQDEPTSSTTSWQRFRWRQFLWFILQVVAVITFMLGCMAEPATRERNNTEKNKNSRNKGASLSTTNLNDQHRRSPRPVLEVLPSWQSVFSDVTTTIATALPLFGPDGPAWRLDSDDGIYENLTTQIPGDIISDLMREGLIEEPYMDRNFLTQNHVWMGYPKVIKQKNPIGNNSTFLTRKPLHSSILKDDDSLQQRTRTWTYSTQFEMDNAPNDDGNEHNNTSEALKWMLVVEGVKMGAIIYFNGIVLGTITDQFLRFTWVLNEQDHFSKGIPTTNALHRQHELSVSFDPTIGVNGRFMACSGGWDWAPYTQTGDSQGRGVFTFGIVKPIYLVPLRHFAITHVVPKIYYQGSYPRVPMLDGPNADFTVLVDVHLLYPEHTLDDMATNPINSDVWVWSEFSGTQRRTATTSHPIDPTLGVTVILTFNLTASKEDVKLWWPNGLGMQPMYDILVGTGDPYHFDPEASPSGICKRIGRYGLAWHNACAFIQPAAHSAYLPFCSLRQVFERQHWSQLMIRMIHSLSTLSTRKGLASMACFFE